TAFGPSQAQNLPSGRDAISATGQTEPDDPPMRFFPPETDRLILRRFTPADLDAAVAYQGLEEVARYCMWEPRSRERVRELIPRWIAMNGEGEASEGLQYAVERKTDGQMIGDAVL